MLSFHVLLLLYPLVVLSSHRLWNRERIFALGRRLTRRVPGLNCEACNIFWIALAWACALPLISLHPVVAMLYLATAVYAPVRFAMLAYPIMDGRDAPSATPGKKCKTCGQGTSPHEKAAKFPKRLALFVEHPYWDHKNKEIASLITILTSLLKTKEWYVKVLVPLGVDMGSIAAYYTDMQKTTGINITEALDTVILQPETGQQQIGQLQKHLMLMGNGVLLSLSSISGEKKDVLDKAGSLRGFRTIYMDPLIASDLQVDSFLTWLNQQRDEAVTRKT